MASVKATFTLDEESVRKLAQASKRSKRSKSEIVREAILDYSEREGRLNNRERLAMLRTIDEFAGRVPPRSQEEVDAELAAIREARRRGGRRTPVEDA